MDFLFSLMFFQQLQTNPMPNPMTSMFRLQHFTPPGPPRSFISSQAQHVWLVDLRAALRTRRRSGHGAIFPEDMGSTLDVEFFGENEDNVDI